jgi:ABC-2 type transport system ATP-binding protein
MNAVNNLNLKFNKGEILGYLGVNGAGKSTTIKMLTGILVPTQGKISVLGKEPYKNRKEIAKKIGVVFGQRSQLIWDIAPIETFNLFSKIYEIPKKEYKDTLDYIVNYMKIENLLNIPVRKLSLGQRMCCEIVASLLHKPEILFLDEPTIGLDIINKEKIRSFIKKLNKDNKTSILLTTHDLGDVEKLCNRIVIIDKGNKVYDGSIKEIKDKFGTISTLKVEFNNVIHPIYFNRENIKVENDTNSIYIKYDKKNKSTPIIINEIMEKNSDIKDISILESNIEDIVKDIYQKNSLGTIKK